MAATVERVVVDVSVAVAKALQRAAGAARDVSVSFCTSMWHRVVMPLWTFALDHVISPAARTGRALWSAGVRACISAWRVLAYTVVSAGRTIMDVGRRVRDAVVMPTAHAIHRAASVCWHGAISAITWTRDVVVISTATFVVELVRRCYQRAVDGLTIVYDGIIAPTTHAMALAADRVRYMSFMAWQRAQRRVALLWGWLVESIVYPVASFVQRRMLFPMRSAAATAVNAGVDAVATARR